MPIVYRDRTQETCTVASTTVTLLGAITGYQPFSADDDGKQFYLSMDDGTCWMTFIGTYTDGGRTISVDVILASSAAGSIPTFSGTIKIRNSLVAAMFS